MQPDAEAVVRVEGGDDPRLVAGRRQLVEADVDENAAGAARTLPAEAIRIVGFSAIELLALPLRIAAYGLTWWPQRRRT